MLRIFLYSGFLFLLAGLKVYSHEARPPDLSAIGDFKIFSHNDKNRSDEKEKLNIAQPEMELCLEGEVSPGIHGNIVLAWHKEHQAEIEEIYVTIQKGLPLKADFRVGKYLLEFGRLNPVHKHEYSFIKRPLPHEIFFGDEGLSDMAIRALVALPVGGIGTEVMGAVLKGEALKEHEHEAAEEEETHQHKRYDPGFFGRLAGSWPVSETNEIAFGVSAVNTVYAFCEHEEEAGVEEPVSLRSWLIGGDIRYKYQPSRYSTVQMAAEVIVAWRDSGYDRDFIKSYGAYGFLDFHFRGKYNVGAIIEWVRLREIYPVNEENGATRSDTWRSGVFFGYAPFEETSQVRLAAHGIQHDKDSNAWEINLQLVICLGSHEHHH